jgi:hypothetical protein
MNTLAKFAIASLPFTAGTAATLSGAASAYAWIGFGCAWVIVASRELAE